MEDITWHEGEPEQRGTIIIQDEDGYYDIWSWSPFFDLKHNEGWYGCMGEYPCSKIVRYARIE